MTEPLEKRLQQHKEAHTALLAGIEAHDATQANLAERAAALTVWCSEREGSIMGGSPIDMVEYSAAVTALSGLLKALRFDSTQARGRR